MVIGKLKDRFFLVPKPVYADLTIRFCPIPKLVFATTKTDFLPIPKLFADLKLVLPISKPAFADPKTSVSCLFFDLKAGSCRSQNRFCRSPDFSYPITVSSLLSQNQFLLIPKPCFCCRNLNLVTQKRGYSKTGFCRS